jgi:hypothetical protein
VGKQNALALLPLHDHLQALELVGIGVVVFVDFQIAPQHFGQEQTPRRPLLDFVLEQQLLLHTAALAVVVAGLLHNFELERQETTDAAAAEKLAELDATM